MAIENQSSVRSYLCFYNVLACALWSYVLALVVGCVVKGDVPASFFSDHALAINVAQFIAVFEIVHSAVGWVSSPVQTVFVQVGSRFLVLFGILNQVEDLQKNWAVLVLLFAWSLSEVPRYLYYALNLLNAVPQWLLWTRYSLFLVLYPLGIASELFFIYKGMPFFKQTDKWSIHMPNRLNFAFSFHQLLMWILVLYLPGSPHMYSHMCRQRSKYLSTKTTQENQKKEA